MERNINTGIRQHRFPKGMELPIPGENEEVAKFHGEARIIPAPLPGEQINKNGFAPSQEIVLVQMESERLMSIQDAHGELVRSDAGVRFLGIYPDPGAEDRQ